MVTHAKNPLLAEIQSLRKGTGLTLGKINKAERLKAALGAKTAQEAHDRFLRLMADLGDSRPAEALKNALNLVGDDTTKVTDRRNNYARKLKPSLHEDTVEADENRAIDEIIARLNASDSEQAYGTIRGVVRDCRLERLEWNIFRSSWGGAAASPESRNTNFILYVVPYAEWLQFLSIEIDVRFEGICPNRILASRYDSTFELCVDDAKERHDIGMLGLPQQTASRTWTDLELGEVLEIIWAYPEQAISPGQLKINPFTSFQEWQFEEMED